MYSNKTLLAVILLSSCTICLGFHCNKHFDCRGTVYNFEMGIKAYPDKDSIHTGDTIWLEVDEPTTFKDIQTGRMVDYSNAANLGTAISFAQLLSINSTDNQAASEFHYNVIHGNEILRPDSAIYREYKFQEVNGQYKFKLAIIPTVKGIYKMFISNAANVTRTNDRCTKANFEINFKNTNQHLHLNQISFPDITLPQGGGVYLFKVE